MRIPFYVGIERERFFFFFVNQVELIRFEDGLLC